MKENELPFHIQEAIHNYEMIETEGLKLYPVRVREYLLFQIGRTALEVLQASFPVAYMSMPLLQVYFQMDVIEPAVNSNEKPTGLFGRALLMLALSLRLGDGRSAEERMRMFTPVINPADPRRLKSVRAVTENGEAIEITPVQFQRLRPIIAAQNGVELESDNANPEIVQAERELSAMNNASLNINFFDELTFVAGKLHMRTSEMKDWALKEVEDHNRMFVRELMFTVSGIGGAFGGFGKSGNPFPHPVYEKKSNGSAAIVPLSNVMNGAAQNAVQKQT